MNNELINCPFCGGKVRFNNNANFEPDGVYCPKCHAFTKFTNISHNRDDRFEVTIHKISDAWNRRTND